MHFWTDGQKQFLKEHYPNNNRNELLVLFNEHFNLDLRIGQLKACLKNHKIHSGRTGHFETNSVPFNKGMKGINFCGERGKATQFKKGDQPKNYKPVGTERVDRDGYILMKVSDIGEWHHRWRHKHKVVWEEANGPIPEGHCLIFLDRNKLNANLDNLLLISKAQLSRMNQNKLFQNDPELTRIGVIIAEIQTKMGALNKKEK